MNMSARMDKVNVTIKVFLVTLSVLSILSAIVLGLQGITQGCSELDDPGFYLLIFLIISTISVFFSLSYVALKYGFTLTQFLYVIEKQEHKVGFPITVAIYISLTAFMGIAYMNVLYGLCT